MSTVPGSSSCVLDKNGYYQPLSLVEICARFLAQNIRLCEGLDLGGIDDSILSSVVVRAGSRVTAELLLSLESTNKYLINSETDMVWKRLSRSKYGRATELENTEYDTWRELYLAKEAERNHKMKNITVHKLRRKRKLELAQKHHTKSLVVVEGIRPPSKMSKHVSSLSGSSRGRGSYRVADRDGTARVVRSHVPRSRRGGSGSASSCYNPPRKNESKMTKLLRATARDTSMMKKRF